MGRQITIRELREALPALEQLVEREGELVITRHGRPLAKVVSLRPGRRVPTHDDLRASIPPSPVGSEQLIREERDRERGRG